MTKQQNVATSRLLRSFLLTTLSLSITATLQLPAKANIWADFVASLFGGGSSDLRRNDNRRGSGGHDICSAEKRDDTQKEINEAQTETVDDNSDNEILDDLVAFVPAENAPGHEADNKELLIVGYTEKEYPRVWLYIPRSDQPDTALIEFSIYDDQAYLFPPIKLELPDSPGVASIQVPTDRRGLQPGIAYTWRASIQCVESGTPSTMHVVKGQILHTLAMTDESQTTETHEDYQERNIWYEAIDYIALNRSQNDEDWLELLEYFKFGSNATDIDVHSSPLIELR